MLKEVVGAGTFLFYDEGDKNKYLILLNSQTNIWEPAKGLKEISESHLACAIRECNEETSIEIDLEYDLIYSPNIINYRVSKKNLKSIKIFPVKIPSIKTVILSREHKDFAWIDWEDAKQRNISKTLKTCYFDIICKIENSNIRKNNNIKQIITKSLKDLVRDNKDLDFEWILAGSIAANEFTIYRGEIYSDIDLVAIGEVVPDSYRRRQINELIKSSLSEKELFHKLNIGIMFIRKSTAIDSSTPFGSYLKQNAFLINSSPNQMRFFENGLDDNSYNLFRLFWYTCLRSLFFDEIECNYHYLKALLLLFYFKNRTVFSHFSYSAIKDQVLVFLTEFSSRDREDYLITLLQAADTKLNHSNFLLNRDWKILFLNELDSIRCELKGEENVILNEMFKISANKFHVSEALKELFELHFTNVDINDLYINACKKSDKSFIWVLLILLRIKIWPCQVSLSTEKYADNIKLLLKSSTIILNESTINKMSIIFEEFGWNGMISQNRDCFNGGE